MWIQSPSSYCRWVLSNKLHLSSRLCILLISASCFIKNFKTVKWDPFRSVLKPSTILSITYCSFKHCCCITRMTTVARMKRVNPQTVFNLVIVISYPRLSNTGTVKWVGSCVQMAGSVVTSFLLEQEVSPWVGEFFLLKLLFYYKAEILTKMEDILHWSIQHIFVNDSMIKSTILMEGSMMSIITHKQELEAQLRIHEWAHEWAHKNSFI